MTDGTILLQIRHPDFLPLDINFRDYGIRSVESKVTYVLTLVKPQTGTAVQDEDSLRFVALSVQPATAVVMIDDVLPPLNSKGEANVLLKMGDHTWEATAPNYESLSGSFYLGDVDRFPLTIKLDPAMATLSVTCATAGAQLFVNDELRGTGAWTGTLPQGTYRVEARKEGFYQQRRNVTLTKNGNEKVDFPALTAITGRLKVNYVPQEAEVWMDGNKLGTSPALFRDIPVGHHKMEIRAEGYETAYLADVIITEGQTRELNGELKAKSVVQTPPVVPSQPATGPSSVNNSSTSDLLPASCVYVQASFQAGSLMGAEAGLGAYLSRFNVEAHWLLGLSKSEDIYWNPSTSEGSSVLCTYKPTAFGLRLGYGIAAGRSLRLTPQAGASIVSIKSSSGDSKGNATAATLGLRADYALAPHISLFAAPEMAFAVSKSDIYGQLADVSSKIKSWATGFNVRVGLLVSF